MSRFLLPASSCAPSGQYPDGSPGLCLSPGPATPLTPWPPQCPAGPALTAAAQHRGVTSPGTAWAWLIVRSPRLGPRVPGRLTRGLGCRRARGGASDCPLGRGGSPLPPCPLTVPSVSGRWGSASWTWVLTSALEQGCRSEYGGPVARTELRLRPESRQRPADTRSLYCQSCHEGHCPFMLTECPACKGLVRLGEKEHHLEHECPERSLSCRHCRAPCCPADMKAHHQVCPKFPLTCDGCGKKKIAREKFQDHVRTCGRCRVPCRFHAVGCPEMVESEKQQEHEAQRLREHLALLLRVLLEAGRPPGDGRPLLSQGEGAWEASTPSRAAELLQRCEALERKTATFENIVCVLNREVERVAVTAEACGRQHRLDQDRIEALSSKVQQLERSIGLKDLAMADLEQKVLEMEASTFDGVFIWKISDFSRKRQEAVAGRTPAIFSPAFYTSRYGYKMCLRAYLNGDGTGRGTHLSLFFVLMRGPHDALLRWPFNQKVTLMLLDQNHREHVIDAFRPDVTSSSFQRPVSDMNIASGCPLFCPVSKMEAKNSYVRDDAIFIKAIVDLTGL